LAEPKLLRKHVLSFGEAKTNFVSMSLTLAEPKLLRKHEPNFGLTKVFFTHRRKPALRLAKAGLPQEHSYAVVAKPRLNCSITSFSFVSFSGVRSLVSRIDCRTSSC